MKDKIKERIEKFEKEEKKTLDSDDEALEKKENSDKEIDKCELIKELGEIGETMKKNREIMEERFRQAKSKVKGEWYENKVEETRKFVREKCVSEEVHMRRKYEEAKKA